MTHELPVGRLKELGTIPGRFGQVIRIFYKDILGNVRSVVKVKRDIKGIGVCDKSNNNDYKNMYNAVIAIIPESRVIAEKPVDFHISFPLFYNSIL